MTASEIASVDRTLNAGSTQSSVAGLVSGIIDDAQKLAHQQFEMFKAELKEDLNRTKRAAEFGGIGLALLTIGGVTLVAFLVNLLHEQFHFSMWASCLIIGLVAVIGGLACMARVRSLFETFNPLPTKTITALEENLTWKTQPQA
jgi:uncharacterized membrane protein YqjE